MTKNSKHKAKALMIQGTGSDAGKSIIAAALCRIFKQDGIKTAPFKAQNMALNSYVTPNGCEIGRAQALQAKAAGIEIDVRMNPVLLKPDAVKGTQVIMNGKVVENMIWKDYINYKQEAFKEICQAYDSLAAEYAIVVLEGAGSPAEVNLKKHDIVNMNMARYAEAPVIIAGDIDKGGIYASFVGTMEIFEPWEKELTAGFLINRFRGESALLKDANDYMFKKTGKPVLGVIPYINDLNLPQEDSVSFGLNKKVKTDWSIDIAVIALPHISNFTDLDAFEVEDDVRIRLVKNVSELGRPDCIIIPGSKSTVYDLEFLRITGLAERIFALFAEDTEIFGICGGFQMLGKTINDPKNIESEIETVEALGLLQIHTTMESSKTLQRIALPNNIEGYEIHHGSTEILRGTAIKNSDGRILGVCENNIQGTYLHGIFDNDLYRLNFLNHLRSKKGLPLERHPQIYDIEDSLNKLADTVRESVDMDKIYQIMEI